MTGPRLIFPASALALFLLLPACTPRQPIPSDPPPPDLAWQEPAPAEQASPGAAPAPAPAAKVAPAPKAAKPAAKVEAKPEVKIEAKPVEVKAETKPEIKVEAKPVEVKTEANPGAQPVAPVPSATASASQQLDAAHAAAVQAPVAERPALVQIASFNTEKNAQGALSWLKQKGYAEARVVRVEQGQTVFHRVQAGPFQDLAAARKALEELRADWPQAFIPAD